MLSTTWLCYRQNEFECKILVDYGIDKTTSASLSALDCGLRMLNITLHSKSPWAVWVEQVCKSECSGMRPACAKHYVIARTSWHVKSWLIMLSTRRVGRSNPGWLCYRQDEFACKILVDHVLDKTRWNVKSWLIMLLTRRVGMSTPGWLWDRQDEL